MYVCWSMKNKNLNRSIVMEMLNLNRSVVMGPLLNSWLIRKNRGGISPFCKLDTKYTIGDVIRSFQNRRNNPHTQNLTPKAWRISNTVSISWGLLGMVNYQLWSRKIMHLVASVRPSVCLFVCALLSKPFAECSKEQRRVITSLNSSECMVQLAVYTWGEER